MIAIIKEIKNGFQHLFPSGRFRYVLIVLAISSAGISVSELLVMKFFVKIVVQEGDIERNQFILLGSGMALFFLLTRLSQYYQKIYRVKAFERAFKGLKKVKNRGAKNPEWAMAFEVSTLFTQGTQLLAVLAFFAIIEPIFALANLVVVVIVLAWIGRIFNRHLVVQRELHTRVDGEVAKPHRRYGERIKAGELGALIAGGGIVLLLGLLLYMSYIGEISLSNTLIIFFGTRLQNGSLTTSSRSLMRYAKFKVSATINDENDA